MARAKRRPHIRALADRVHAAFQRCPQNLGITESWLLSRYGDPKLSDDELELLYLDLLRQLSGGGGGGGEPPPQKERRQGRDTR